MSSSSTRTSIICTLDKKQKFETELEVRVGRGFCHRRRKQAAPISRSASSPIDSIFSPVTRVKYAVENTRVGQRTDYDKLDARDLDRRPHHAR